MAVLLISLLVCVVVSVCCAYLCKSANSELRLIEAFPESSFDRSTDRPCYCD